MNRAEVMAKWDAMTPRERDAWIHEKIFNQHVQWCTSGNGGKYPFCVPHYSEKIEAAFEVVEKVYSMLFSVRRKFLEELQKIISIEKLTGLDRHIAWPDVFWYITPEKICKAALLAVGVEHGQE